MTEKNLVEAIVNGLKNQGFVVATEVANFYRSADVAAIDPNGQVWIIECKVSAIARAIEQTRIHKLSADRVFVATFHKKTKPSTIARIRRAGVGLLYVREDGRLDGPVCEPRPSQPWSLARKRLVDRIKEGA